MTTRKWFLSLGALALLVTLGTSTSQAVNNPNGWVETRGWNYAFLDSPKGCGAITPAEMLQNPVPPHNIVTENPKAGTQWGNIAYSPLYPASQDGNLGGGPTVLTWVSNAFLEAAFGLPAGSIPNGDLANWNDVLDYLNANVIPNVPGAVPISTDTILGLATTYVENQGPPIVIEVCQSSDDGIQTWINNKLVSNVDVCRGSSAGCSELTRAILPSGFSQIQMLVWEEGGGFNGRLGIRVAGSGVNLADGSNPLIIFHGAGVGNAAARSQEQYCVARTTAIKEFNCPNDNVTVTVTGSGPGADGDNLTVCEIVRAATPAAIVIGNVSNGGVVSDNFPPPPPVPTPVGPDFDDREIIGTHCGPSSNTVYNVVPGDYVSTSESGGDLWDGSNDFEFAYNKLAGDFDLSLKLTGRTHSTGNGAGDSGRWGKFGLLARQQLQGCSRHTMTMEIFPDPQDAVRLQGRTTHGVCGTMYEETNQTGPVQSNHPNYLRLTRVGQVLRGWISDGLVDTDADTVPDVEEDPTNDAVWTRVGREDDWGAGIPGELFVGFANSEHNVDGCQVQTATFEFINFTGTKIPLVGPPVPDGKKVTWTVTRAQLNAGLKYDVAYGQRGSVSLSGETLNTAIHSGPNSISYDPAQSGPVGPQDGEWAVENSHDIGTPATPGSTVYAAGAYTVSGTGGDIWDGGDSFHYAYWQQTGDFQVTARVANITMAVRNDRWGRAGVMARYTCNDNSKYSLACVPFRGEAPNAGVGGTHGVDGNDTLRHQTRAHHLNTGTSQDNRVLSARQRATVGEEYKVWVRLTRRGKYFYSQFAPDVEGQPGPWELAGADTHPNPPDTLLVGLASSSHGSGPGAGLSPLVVTYDNVSCVPPPPLKEYGCIGEQIYIDEFIVDGPLGPNAAVNVVGAFTPAVVAGRLKLTNDGVNDSAVSVYFDFDGAGLGDIAFRAEFDAYYSGAGDPADGMHFAVTEASFAQATGLLGGGGGSSGYDRGDHNAIPASRYTSVSVEIDNWNGGHGTDDTSNRHIGLDYNEDNQSAQNSDQVGIAVPPINNVPEGNHIELRYIPEGDVSRLDVYVTDNVTLVRTHLLSTVGPRIVGDAIVGFTAATGGANATHEVDNLKISELCCECPDSVQITGPATGTAGGPPVTLTAVADGMEGAFTYAWSIDSGPPSATVATSGPTDDTAEVSVTNAAESGPVVVRVTVADGDCADTASATHTVTFSAGGGRQKPQDFNQDGKYDISDEVGLLGFLFQGQTGPPCGPDFNPANPANSGNITLLDCNGDGKIDISDVICALGFLFQGGPRPVLCIGDPGNPCPCVLIVNCPDNPLCP